MVIGREKDGRLIISLNGEITSYNAPEVEEQIQNIRKAYPTAIQFSSLPACIMLTWALVWSIRSRFRYSLEFLMISAPPSGAGVWLLP